MSAMEDQSKPIDKKLLLFRHQLDALNQMQAVIDDDELSRKNFLIFLVSLTASGKTTLSKELYLDQIAKGRAVVFLSHRTAVVAQALALGIPSSTVQSLLHVAKRIDKKRKIAAPADGERKKAMSRKRRNRMMRRLLSPLYGEQDAAFLASRDIIAVVDEAHHGLSNMSGGYRKALSIFGDSLRNIIGLTATPKVGLPFFTIDVRPASRTSVAKPLVSEIAASGYPGLAKTLALFPQSRLLFCSSIARGALLCTLANAACEMPVESIALWDEISDTGRESKNLDVAQYAQSAFDTSLGQGVKDRMSLIVGQARSGLLRYFRDFFSLDDLKRSIAKTPATTAIDSLDETSVTGADGVGRPLPVIDRLSYVMDEGTETRDADSEPILSKLSILISLLFADLYRAKAVKLRRLIRGISSESPGDFYPLSHTSRAIVITETIKHLKTFGSISGLLSGYLPDPGDGDLYARLELLARSPSEGVSNLAEATLALSGYIASSLKADEREGANPPSQRQLATLEAAVRSVLIDEVSPSDFASGTVPNAVSVMKVAEGFDYPNLSTVVFVDKVAASKTLYIQRAGRGARLHHGKNAYHLIEVTFLCPLSELGSDQKGTRGVSWRSALLSQESRAFARQAQRLPQSGSSEVSLFDTEACAALFLYTDLIRSTKSLKTHSLVERASAAISAEALASGRAVLWRGSVGSSTALPDSRLRARKVRRRELNDIERLRSLEETGRAAVTLSRKLGLLSGDRANANAAADSDYRESVNLILGEVRRLTEEVFSTDLSDSEGSPGRAEALIPVGEGAPLSAAADAVFGFLNVVYENVSNSPASEPELAQALGHLVSITSSLVVVLGLLEGSKNERIKLAGAVCLALDDVRACSDWPLIDGGIWAFAPQDKDINKEKTVEKGCRAITGALDYAAQQIKERLTNRYKEIVAAPSASHEQGLSGVDLSICNVARRLFVSHCASRAALEDAENWPFVIDVRELDSVLSSFSKHLRTSLADASLDLR